MPQSIRFSAFAARVVLAGIEHSHNFVFFFFPEFLGSTFLELFDDDELLPPFPRLVRAGDENAMMQAVAQQPVAVAIDGDDRVFLGAFQGSRW